MARVLGAVLVGIDGVPVEVEVRIHAQLPRVDVVGLAETAVRESAARVRAAIGAAGHKFPERRVTVNLAPAAVRKTGAGLDLPIAIGILAAAGALDDERLPGLGLIGELALDGRLRPVRGALSLALALRDHGCARIVVPRANGTEAALTPQIAVLPADDLPSVLRYLATGAGLDPAPPPEIAATAAERPDPGLDLAEIRGQERAKRALEVAAAGGHGVFFRGPPGSGKTMLARRLPGLLPTLDFAEALEVTRVYGAAGRLPAGQAILRDRPFRAPHHAASRAGLLGGGAPPRPGEVSLAHRGVLFLDELPEFDRGTLESLRQVLEERRVVVARAGGSFVFPADFQLIAAANPCPCGYRLSQQRDCRCTDAAVARYRQRLSGPLLDRIDLHLGVPAVAWRELLDIRPPGEPSTAVRARVGSARAIQQTRLAPLDVRTNAEIPDAMLDAMVDATSEARALLGRAVEKLRLTARGARRLLRVARTIADLESAVRVEAPAMAEALGYRRDEVDA
jgi:magnesium chelatase family protein